MGPPFYNRVAVPIGLFLIFLTGVGPLLAWRATSIRSIRRNLLLPCLAIIVSAIVLMITGLRPWNEADGSTGAIYSLVCFSLSAGVITAIVSEFLRGANVVRTADRQRNLLPPAPSCSRAATPAATADTSSTSASSSSSSASPARRSTKAKNWKCPSATRSRSAPTSSSASPTRRTPTPTTTPTTLSSTSSTTARRSRSSRPERRFYNASQQTSTIVAIHSTLARDLYVVFEGRNPETDKPIIKVFLNPLVNWIWIGVGIVIFGTGIALVPPLKPGAPSSTTALPSL